MSSNYLNFPTKTFIIFLVLIIGAVSVDLFMHRHNKMISLKSTVMWSSFWLLIAMVFAALLCFFHGIETATLFLTSYALEEILSVDNLFVMMAIFDWFKIPDKYRYRILCWGLIGAVFFRGIFVMIGTGLLKFLGPYIEIFFVLIVIYTAVMMLKRNKNNIEIKDYSNHIAYRLIRRIFPIWPVISSHKFIVSQKDIEIELEKPESRNLILVSQVRTKYYITPLLLCTVIVELSDITFAFDSLPAIIGISKDPLIIYSSTIFAVIGLRTFYFMLEILRENLLHLEKAIILLLFFVSFKLSLNVTDCFWHHGYSISANISLLLIVTILLLGVIISLFFSGKK